MRSEIFLKCIDSELMQYGKQHSESVFVFPMYFTPKFFDLWGEIWQMEFWIGGHAFYEPFRRQTLAIAGNNSIQIETEVGKTFIPLPTKGTVQIPNVGLIEFPHLIKPNEPFFEIHRIRSVSTRSKTKNAMPSMQQDPF